MFPHLGRGLDRGPEYSAVKERWVHTCVLILLRVWDEGGETGSCTIPRRAICVSIGSTSGVTLYPCTATLYRSAATLYRSAVTLYRSAATLYRYTATMYRDPLPIYRHPLPICRHHLPLYCQCTSLLMYSRCIHIRHVVE